MFLELASRSFFPVALFTALLAAPLDAQCVETVDLSIGGHHNPFLAGQPAGTTLGNDVVPAQAPFQVPLSLVGGELMRFVGVSGQLQHEPLTLQLVTGGPEGDLAQIAVAGPSLGISGFHMPLNALLGVFTGGAPNAGAAPAELDFSASSSRDFDHLEPALFQIFFIGNGLREDGTTLQTFEVPLGATSLYLGSADFGQWYDNDGALQMSIEQEVADITPFCTAKLSSEGCLPSIDYTGYPALAGTHEFNIVCSEVSPKTKAVLFYGRAQYEAPFQGGLLVHQRDDQAHADHRRAADELGRALLVGPALRLQRLDPLRQRSLPRCRATSSTRSGGCAIRARSARPDSRTRSRSSSASRAAAGGRSALVAAAPGLVGLIGTRVAERAQLVELLAGELDLGRRAAPRGAFPGLERLPEALGLARVARGQVA